MISFESPTPSVEMLKNRIDRAEAEGVSLASADVCPVKDPPKKNTRPPEIAPRVSSSSKEIPKPVPADAPADVLPPKSKSTPVATVQQSTKAADVSQQSEEEQITVSNVIKRFNDKCESLAKGDVNRVFHSVQSGKECNARPVYATMDCRSKRNHLMSRGYTVTEYSIRAESFRRQASEAHTKVRSKSQSSAGYDVAEAAPRGTLPSYRVRFDESSLRGCDQRKSPAPGYSRRSASAGNSDQEGDDDMFEKYETLV